MPPRSLIQFCNWTRYSGTRLTTTPKEANVRPSSKHADPDRIRSHLASLRTWTVITRLHSHQHHVVLVLVVQRFGLQPDRLLRVVPRRVGARAGLAPAQPP